MRAFTPLFLLGSLILSLACGGFGDTKTEEAAVVPLVVAPSVWEVTRQDGQALVKAGATQGLAVDAQLVLLGPPLAGTENRRIVGSAKVTEIWPDLARVTPDRLERDAPEPAAARLYTAEDQAALDAIPLVGGPKGARAAAAPVAADPVASIGEFTVDQVPAELKSGTSDARMDALVRYESDGSMTNAIVWVLKNDNDAAVQFKAWRVVRARWKRGTGSAAEHEAAAAWVAMNGGDDARVEALEALGDRSRSLTVPAKHLADPLQNVRIAAGKAVFDIGGRTGKRSEAKKLLEDRRDVESASPVRKRLGDWIEEL